MTLDGWRFEVVQKVIDDGHPYAWIFFLTFIFLASFAVLNLFIALIVDALQQEQNAMREELLQHQTELIDDIEVETEEVHRDTDELLLIVKELRTEITDLKDLLNAKK